ncbi:hypothetical protein TS70_05830 [Spiroplasma sp. hyd1]|nr:hypothetical protein [Spiroplasma sp. hyd1]
MKERKLYKMKKLLSLLSVLTISGTAVPTTIAASPYEKQEENKTQTSTEYSIFKNDASFKTPRLYVNWNANDYFDKLKKQILKSLLDNGIILNLNNSGGTSYFAINNTQFNSFVIPFSVERDNQSINIDLVFRSSDFYLQGFSYDTIYYHFSDSTITSINGQTPRNLNFDSNYNTLIGDSNPTISWSGIEQAFNDLVNYGENPGNNSVIRGALARVILATAESMRFRQVRENIERTYNQNIQLYWRDDFYPIITNWSRTTSEAINYLEEHENSLDGFTHISKILIFTSVILMHLNSCGSFYYKNNTTCYDKPILSKFLTENQQPVEYFLEWRNGEEKIGILDINLGREIPTYYNKIIFFNEEENKEVYSKFSWGGNSHWGWNVNDIFKNKNIKDIITNVKVVSDSDAKKYANKELIDIKWRGSARGKVYTGLTFYWKEDNTWHLQILTYLYGESWASWSGGASWHNLGRRIELS